MKNIVRWVSLVATLGILVVGWLPQTASALTPSDWKGRYEGVWDDTYDTCGDTDQDGTIIIRILKLNSTGRISSAAVFFSDDVADRIDATGRIYKQNGQRRIRLKYLLDSGSYIIDARLTNRKRIIGGYDHDAGGCQWGGTVDATRV